MEVSTLSFAELKDFLDSKVELYNNSNFIETDPIQIPHQFSKKEDIEIVAFIIATIAWGNRKSIITNGKKLVQIMGNQPHEFVMNYDSKQDFKFVHRTFNAIDLDFFFRSLHKIYQTSSLEEIFRKQENHFGAKGRIASFRETFFKIEHDKRSEKHVSNPLQNSACKRLNMLLRWLVRKDKKGVDFGIWNSIDTSELYLPLDVHTGNVARKLGILQRTKNDWHALEEIQQTLIKLDPKDPVKYDFALFGLGAFEGF
ncbi:MAG: TIGR02757 family protein [Bacteroidota bacterium]